MADATTTENKPAAPAVEKITVSIDGQVVAVPKTTADPLTGKQIPTTMIQACALAKVDVPHYCYHPKLPVAGNCRMCLVEFGTPAMGPDRKPVMNPDGTPKIAKSPRPAIACATPISPGMEIYTATPAVKQMREGVLEFLLINHPLDCPICDQAGECKLQEYSVDYGKSESRFVEPKVHKPKRVDLGPRIVLDDERCIRFTKDVAGDDALGIVNRGSYNTITAFPGKQFDNNYTLNTVDICPVGALTSKDFRFKMRVWFLKETKSVCTSCATGCNTIVGSREDVMYRYEPRENDAVNSTWMCDYGRLNYKWINRPDRLAEVQKNKAKTAWPTAVKEISELLNKAQQGSVAIIASARQTNEELFLLKKLATKLGAVSDSIPRTGESDKLLLSADRNPNSNGSRLTGISGGKMGEQISMIVSDIVPSETTKLAHYLLPGCAHVEKRGTFTNGKGRVQKFMKALEPRGDARPEWEFLHELVFHVTGQDGYATIEGLFNLMAKEVPAFNGLTWAGLGDTGVTVPI